MSKKAFPVNRENVHEMIEIVDTGMNLLDYFAGHALQGLLNTIRPGDQYSQFAETAYRIAEKMMEERGKYE